MILSTVTTSPRHTISSVATVVVVPVTYDRRQCCRWSLSEVAVGGQHPQLRLSDYTHTTL